MKLAHSLALVSLLLIGAPALAENQIAVNPQAIAEAKAPACAAKISLSDSQRQQLAALRDKYELATAEQKALLHVTYRQLKSVLRADTVDKAQAQALQTKINGLRDDLANARLNLRLAVSDVFTPEQKEAFKQMHRAHHHHFAFRPFGPRPEVG